MHQEEYFGTYLTPISLSKDTLTEEVCHVSESARKTVMTEDPLEVHQKHTGIIAKTKELQHQNSATTDGTSVNNPLSQALTPIHRLSSASIEETKVEHPSRPDTVKDATKLHLDRLSVVEKTALVRRLSSASVDDSTIQHCLTSATEYESTLQHCLTSAMPEKYTLQHRLPSATAKETHVQHRLTSATISNPPTRRRLTSASVERTLARHRQSLDMLCKNTLFNPMIYQ